MLISFIHGIGIGQAQMQTLGNFFFSRMNGAGPKGQLAVQINYARCLIRSRKNRKLDR
ncbi:MAG: hypothetical protein R3C11_00640 [Planctomycetaceae bacterium]